MTASSDSARHPFVCHPHRTVLLALSMPVRLSLVAEPVTGLVDTAFVAQLGASLLVPHHNFTTAGGRAAQNAMQYGAHCYLFTDCWRDASLPILDEMKAMGLDLAELSVGDDVVFTTRLTRDRAEALGLSLVIGPGGAWPIEADLSADEAGDRARGLAWHCRQVDLAAEIGAVAYAGALYGHPGVVKRRRPPAGEPGWTAEGLHALADYAAARGVKIVLEPMSHFRTHLVNTPAQLMRLLDLADHANLYGLLDTYHFISEVRDYAAAVRTMAPKLWCVHTCENDRGVPGGGVVPWDELFDALHAAGFDGPLTMEAYNSSIDGGDFAYARGMFHNVCPDGAAFVREGLAFLRPHVARRWGRGE